MGVMVAMSPCYVCGQIFEYSPTRVPSVIPEGGTFADRQPVCADCVVRINEKRADLGLPAVAVMDGAYEGDPDVEW
jgi:hypothetical protein